MILQTRLTVRICNANVLSCNRRASSRIDKITAIGYCVSLPHFSLFSLFPSLSPYHHIPRRCPPLPHCIPAIPAPTILPISHMELDPPDFTTLRRSTTRMRAYQDRPIQTPSMGVSLCLPTTRSSVSKPTHRCIRCLLWYVSGST